MRLYKYLEPERVDVLKTMHVRFTQPADFNDPFEVVPHVSALLSSQDEEDLLAECKPEPGEFERGLKRALAADGLTITDLDQDLASRGVKLKAKDLLTDAELAEMVHEVVTEFLASGLDEFSDFGSKIHADFSKRFGIFSVSNTPSSLLMWAHYAKSHRGYLIELDSTHIFFHDSRSMGAVGRLFPVRYSVERPPTSVRELAGMHPALGGELVRNVWLTKSAQWAYEGEYRMIFPLDDPDYYPHRTLEDQYHVFPLPPAAITKVILGARATVLTKDAVIKAVISNNQLKHVQLGQARISETKFEVGIEHLDRP